MFFTITFLFFLYLNIINAVDIPIAKHQLVVVESGSNVVVRLKGWDNKNPNMKYSIITPPTSGNLYQLSNVFSNHNIEPKAGIPIRSTSSSTTVTGTNNRVYYTRPSPDVDREELWDTLEYTVYNGVPGSINGGTSYKGTVTFVSPSGLLRSSNFLLNNEDWTIIGNIKGEYNAKYEPFSRGSALNHYIINTDDNIHMITQNGNNNGITNPISSSLTTQKIDASLWYFHAPKKYYSNYGIAYNGYLQFTLGFFSGDLTQLNGDNTNVVEMECSQCIGPVTKGIKLVYKLGKLLSTQKLSSTNGGSTTFTISLLETSGWLIDSQNSLIPEWRAPTQCEMIQVLSDISSINILGDWTTWYETVALDNFKLIANTQLAATKNNINLGNVLPLCAQYRPDASVCSCDE